MAGANSIFSGVKLLTTPNPAVDDDGRGMARLGIRFSAAGPA
jgi:biotin synthase-like enzyme